MSSTWVRCENIVDAMFIQKDHEEIATVLSTQYVIQYMPGYNALGSRDSGPQTYYIMIWKHTPATLSLSTYPFIYNMRNAADLRERFVIINNIIRTAHEKYHTELATICAPHHYYKPWVAGKIPEKYDLYDRHTKPLVLESKIVVHVKQPVTFDQMAVLL